MSCEMYREQIGAYLDSSLGPEELERLQAHLRTCGECSVETVNQVRLQKAVRAAGHRYAPTAEFRNRVRSSVATPRFRFAIWKVALAVTAGIIAAVLAFLTMRSGGHDIGRELADLHVTTLASATPVDVVSEDRHTVKPWFAGKLPFTFNLPELAGTDFKLLGGRVVYLHQVPGAQLLYQLRQHRLSVYLFQDVPELKDAGAEDRVRVEHSFNTVTWHYDGLRCFVVGDVQATDIAALGDLMKRAAEQH